jgi:hypothetical protein
MTPFPATQCRTGAGIPAECVGFLAVLGRVVSALMESASSFQDVAKGLNGFGHPVRIRALVLLERTELSPAELAKLMGDPLGVVAYHVRMLRDYGLVEETRAEPRRGAVQHFYQRTELAEHLLGKLNGSLGVPKVAPGRVPNPGREVAPARAAGRVGRERALTRAGPAGGRPVPAA